MEGVPGEMSYFLGYDKRDPVGARQEHKFYVDSLSVCSVYFVFSKHIFCSKITYLQNVETSCTLFLSSSYTWYK